MQETVIREFVEETSHFKIKGSDRSDGYITVSQKREAGSMGLSLYHSSTVNLESLREAKDLAQKLFVMVEELEKK